nr:His-Xaa-Ser system protein HxsD [uncultured Flavobacterium sp.]
MNNILKFNRELHFSLNEGQYNEDILYKCFYWYAADYNVNIKKENTLYQISISNKTGEDINETLLKKIQQDLIDFKLRDIVTKETKNIRELLTAKAFAHFQTDNDPDTEISDPVGFNPNKF